MFFSVLFLLFCLLSEAMSIVPMFGKCNFAGSCEPGTVCRFEICLPKADPVPVYVYGLMDGKEKSLRAPEKTTSPLPSPNRPQPEQNPNQPMHAPVETIHNVLIQAPPYSSTIQTHLKPCPDGCPGCILGRCICVVMDGQLKPPGCSTFSQFRSLPLPPKPVLNQAHPGDPCEPTTECTGGSMCNIGGTCECPPELIANGQVCVSPAIFGEPHRGLPGYHYSS